MDMRRHLRRSLNVPDLQGLGGCYEGRIADVTEQEVRNRFTTKKEKQPVIVFEDGYHIIPNFGMRRALVERFGSETELWRGERLRIVLRNLPRGKDSQGSSSWTRCVEFLDADVDEPLPNWDVSDDRAGDDGEDDPGDDADR